MSKAQKPASFSWFALSFHAAGPGRLFFACISLAEIRLTQIIQIKDVSLRCVLA